VSPTVNRLTGTNVPGTVRREPLRARADRLGIPPDALVTAAKSTVRYIGMAAVTIEHFGVVVETLPDRPPWPYWKGSAGPSLQVWERTLAFEGSPLRLVARWRSGWPRSEQSMEGLSDATLGQYEDGKLLLRLLRTFDRGRPVGTSMVESAADIRRAYDKLSEVHDRVTKEQLAEELVVSLSTLNRDLKRFGLDWPLNR
jgi:hypothetical protein